MTVFGIRSSADDRRRIEPQLVRQLVEEQFPQWSHLPIKAIQPGGWDNCTFRLGEELIVRLPGAERYAAQVDKEHRWLPRLAPFLPLRIPEPVARGMPGASYPLPWSIYRWIEGEPVTRERVWDSGEFATALARFLVALHRIDTADGPAPGDHNFFRGGPLLIYDNEVRETLSAASGQIDTDSVRAVWDSALAAKWTAPAVWVHGDIAVGNLLLRDGRLQAVIDFGCCGVGDPACDLVIAWTCLSARGRDMLRSTIQLDESTWSRARGWALWKALLVLTGKSRPNPTEAAAHVVIEDVLADHRRRSP